MEEKITAYLDQYLKNNPGRKADELFLEGLKTNAKSFQRLADNHNYEMKLSITEEGTFVVQFSTEQGQVCTTYTYYNAVVAEET